jgi:hypothetical protein
MSKELLNMRLLEIGGFQVLFGSFSFGLYGIGSIVCSCDQKCLIAIALVN